MASHDFFLMTSSDISDYVMALELGVGPSWAAGHGLGVGVNGD